MPEYLSPGVYVEEIDAGPKPIEGVSTSTAGAVGVTARGPDQGKPVLVTSFADFQRQFGGAVTVDDATRRKWSADAELGEFWSFPLAVKGFFDNGGQRLYVRRAVASGATKASLQLASGVSPMVSGPAKAGGLVLKLEHLIGVATGTALTLVVNGVAQAPDLAVQGYDDQKQEVTFAAPGLPLDVVAGRDFVVVRGLPATPAPGVAVDLEASAAGAWGKSVSVVVKPMVAASLNLLADPAEKRPVTDTTTDAANVAVIDVASTADFAQGDWVEIAGARYQLAAAPAAGQLTLDRPLTQPSGTQVRRLPFVKRAGAGTAKAIVDVWGAASLYQDALVEVDSGTAKHFSRVKAAPQGRSVELVDAIPDAVLLLEGHRIRLIELDVSAAYAGTSEALQGLRVSRGAEPSASFLPTRLAAASGLVRVRGAMPDIFLLGDLPRTDPGTAIRGSGGRVALSAGGDDNLASLKVDDFVGADGGPGKRTGILALEDVDEISICLVPGVTSSVVHAALIQHCEALQDRFAVIDPPRQVDTPDKVRAWREPFDTKYAALYWPWIAVRDPFASKTVDVAPSAHVAGIYARVDVERGVHKAPANEVIRGIDQSNGKHGLQLEITKREQDMLNPKAINALRFFPNRGTRVWGARCLTSDMAWKYVSVRRLFIFVEESIDEGTQWVVFEPNDEPTWARVRQSVSNFLTSVWRGGALQGGKADEAFFVRCDHSTMSQDDIDNGRLICVIGIAPVKPAEFVIFRIQQKTLESKAQA
ncbi:MAG: phage tail sheath subtilisin-like domain-containing protein [Kofleriaceae bacterium]|nr:phage tail sheath subtilisin-like domain-containing protein [Myxococcales bacterium]MCB9563791.1 phage tail sheath subtilisin-like domain-containing protein [Kofleriaceae bacterium]MCB9572645.1 phage tail sheath subtilisin-like domain-containing protein [Kofleriaceae bacterium]